MFGTTPEWFFHHIYHTQLHHICCNPVEACKLYSFSFNIKDKVDGEHHLELALVCKLVVEAAERNEEASVLESLVDDLPLANGHEDKVGLAMANNIIVVAVHIEEEILLGLEVGKKLGFIVAYRLDSLVEEPLDINHVKELHVNEIIEEHQDGKLVVALQDIILKEGHQDINLMEVLQDIIPMEQNFTVAY